MKRVMSGFFWGNMRTVPYDWKAILILAILGVILYVAVNYIIFKYATLQKFEQYSASYSYHYGANLVQGG